LKPARAETATSVSRSLVIVVALWNASSMVSFIF
jgi:hypothetical protein